MTGTAERRRRTLASGARHIRTALSVAAAAGGLALAGCGGGASGTSTDGASPAATAQNAAPVGGPLDAVTWNVVYGEPPSLDTITGAGFATAYIDTNLCDTLYRRDPRTGKQVPNLATSMRQVDPRTIVFKIRQGVKFWDGKPLTSEDVAFSLQRNTAPEAFEQGPYFRFVQSARATGDDEVTVKLKQPDALFLGSLPMVLHSAVHEKAVVERDGKSYGSPSRGIMCSGPFKFDSWSPGNQVVVTANRQYWNASLRPKVSRITFKFVTGTSALTTGLLSGDFDGTTDIPAATLPSLQRSSAGKVYSYPSTSQWDLIMAGGPLGDVRVRKALSLAIDRPGIAKVVFRGNATPTTGFFSPASWAQYPAEQQQQFAAANAKLPGAKPDPAGAKAALKGAGAPGPITIGILAGDQVQQQIGTVIQSAAQAAGLKVTLRTLSSSAYQGVYLGPQARQGLDALLLQTTYLDQDPYEGIPFYAAKGGSVNFNNYTNPQVEKAVVDARATADPAERARIEIAAQEQFLGRDQQLIPIVNANILTFVNKRLGGFQPSYNTQWYYPWASLIGAAG